VNLLDDRVFSGNDPYPVMRSTSLKLAPIIVPVTHPFREFINIARYNVRGIWSSYVGFFDRHSIILANFRCIESSNIRSLPANYGENYMSTFRKNTPGVQMGRPPKPPGTGRNKRVVTFVTEDEYAELKVLASDGSTSLSALCNNMVTSALRKECRVRMKK